MKVSAKTIQIFLPEGNPHGIKIAEITSRTVLAILIPRQQLTEAAKREELNGVGVYMLFGQSDAKPQLYIGETENCLNRLKEHHVKKEFWTTALVFVSKTHYFTKTHIKFLEWYCWDIAKKANRYLLDNSNTPSKPHISESAQADLLDNFETMQMLASTLGYAVFDEIKKPLPKEIIICKGKDAYAKGEYTEQGLVVFAHSTCNLIPTNTAGASLISMREQLQQKGVLQRKENVLVFMEDYIFSSPSTAAGVVLARSANGWREWKFNDGRTLDEVKRQNSSISIDAR